MPKLFFTLVILFLFWKVSAQETKVLVFSNADISLILDGGDAIQAEKDAVTPVPISPGEHILQAKSENQTLTEIFTIGEGEQKILKFEFGGVVESVPADLQGDTVNVSNVDFFIPGIVTASAWVSNNPGKEYDEYPKFYYAFEKGDRILIDMAMTNKKGTNTLKISHYPDGNLLHNDNGFQQLNNLEIEIPERGIYQLEFSTMHGFDRNCNIRVRRIPKSPDSKDFNTNVMAITKVDTIYENVPEYTYEAVSIQSPNDFWINSTSNEAFKGGKSRIIVPVSLPQNTVEWYYIVSAYRDPEVVEGTKSSFNLLGQIAGLITQTNGINFAINLLTFPPGADYCDVYLLDLTNQQYFLQKADLKPEGTFRYILQGSRSNIKSGAVRIDCCLEGQWYLGIKNPDSYHGESVIIEAVAIVKKPTGDYVKTPVSVEETVIYQMPD